MTAACNERGGMTLYSIPRSQIDELLFNVLKHIYRWEREVYARFGLTYQEIYLLQYLRKVSPSRISDLAAELRIPMFQATRLVNKLATKQFLSKRKQADDRRGVMVSLLSAGENVIQRVEENNYRIILSNASSLTEEEVQSALVTASDIGRILRISDHE
jgi:DNA-binding MarR family transcriptional regulator